MPTQSKTKAVVGQLAVLAVIIGVIATTGAGAPTITSSNYAEYTAEVITSGGNLTITPKGVLATANNRAAIGDTQAGAVTMSTTNPIARTALVAGNWEYRAEVEAITGVTPASATFRIDLKVNGTVTGTLYIKSDATPATGEKVSVRFDLGTANLGKEQSFVILATQL